jgi:hypothetical protein
MIAVRPTSHSRAPLMRGRALTRGTVPMKGGTSSQGLTATRWTGSSGKWLFGNSREDGGSEWEIALDGKVMRGAWTGENDKVTLFSAMTHRDSVTVAQVSVPAGTNETTQAATLLKALDVLGIPAEDEVLVTLDAARTCQETARAIKKRPQPGYLMNVKGNRSPPQAEVFARPAPLTLEKPHDVIRERSRGKIRQWSCWITGADGISFPSASQVALIRRDVYEISGQPVSKENRPHDYQQDPGEDDRGRDQHVHQEALGNRE